MSFKPFAEGPTRLKQVISFGFYRTGSHFLKESLTILGYHDVFHPSAMASDPAKWDEPGPGTTGTDISGPSEALTDVTPFTEPLLKAFTEARVILVHRDFESWMKSFQRLSCPLQKGFWRG
ncbi:P-loop containing nucleoside triphosphate hydrolase protein [Penicillium frequentans]|nr:P-loop containing nucleoside triphosphate hydrolase protein [Penicillium glabrum]